MSAGRCVPLGAFEELSSFPALIRASRLAARGKRSSPDVAAWLADLETNVLSLSAELRAGAWRPAGYRVFAITDPKPRTICAAPFGERVVHQALISAVEPTFDRGFIEDTYACRKGRGTHAALRRVAGWAATYPWALKMDVRKYFPSIDHSIALELVARRVRCPRILQLFEVILASWVSDEAPRVRFAGDGPGSTERPRGLPIGNLTSQFLANVVLDPVDQRIKCGRGVRPYARYCDDFVVLAHDRDGLRRVRDEIEASLARLRLVPHPCKTHVFPTAQGIPWLGFVVTPRGIRLRESGLRGARRRLRAFTFRIRRGDARPERWVECVRAWAAHASHASGGLRARLSAQWGYGS